MTVFKWSTTAASNATIDDTINARENQAPSTVNDAIRGMMAAIAKWRADMSGNLVTAGTSTAYTLSTNQGYTALTDGIAVAARMDETNGAAPTLNVDSLGAKAIATVYGTAIGTGKLRAGGVYVFVYDSTDDKWIVQGATNGEFASGTRVVFQQTSAPTGWTKDTTHDNKALRLVSGTASTGGSSSFTGVFTNRTLDGSQIPTHTHTFSATTSSDGAHSHKLVNNSTGGAGPPSNFIPTLVNYGNEQSYTLGNSVSAPNIADSSTASAHTHTISGITGSAGSTNPIDFAVAYVDVILAQKD